MRTLVLVRHARAEASAPSDHDRELTTDGHADAAALGEWLAERRVTPDHALVSGAVRTRQTWEDLAVAAGWELAAGEAVEALYPASAESALDLIRATDPAHQVLVVVGHNPTVSTLVQLLDDGRGDDEVGNQLAMGYPTAAGTVLDVPGDWEQLGEATATVRAFHVGRARPSRNW